MKLSTNLFFVIMAIVLCINPFVNAENLPVSILNEFVFTEGPVVTHDGILLFTEVPKSKIWAYDLKTQSLMLYLENTGGANGLYYDHDGNLIACAGTARQMVSIDFDKNVTVLVDEYKEKKLNSPNDLWIDAKGGIYFTDPRYGNADDLEQDGMHVYYITPKKKLIRVIDDMQRPNGVIGSKDGKKLYVVDEKARTTYVYDIHKNGTLKNKTLFCKDGIDGMTLTEKGNICITTSKAVSIYSPEKELLKKYHLDVGTTNVIYYDGRLYVTTHSGEIYEIVLDSGL